MAYAHILGCNCPISGPVGDFSSTLQAVWGAGDADPGPLSDDTGNGFTLAKAGSPSFGQSGLNGNAVLTNSTSTDYFTRAAGFGPDGTEDFSINIWFKSVSSGGQGIFVWRTASNDSLGVYFSNSTTIETWARNGAALYQKTASVAAINDSLWHMVTLTYDQSSKHFTTYFDSVSVISSAHTNALNDQSTGEFRLGQFGYISFIGSNAYFDYSAYWKGSGAVLSPAAISQLYNSRAGFFSLT